MTQDNPDDRPLIYLVDDDDAVCRALALTLDLEGFAVQMCRTGEALLLMDLPPDNAFLILDERLPGNSGLDVLNELRARGVRLPAAIVTTHPKPSLKAAAAAAGVPILEKPLLGDTLVDAVGQGLAKASVRRP